VPPPLDVQDLTLKWNLPGRWAALPKLLLAPVERPSTNLDMIYKLYIKGRELQPENLDIMLRYKAMRTFGAMGLLMNELAGKEVATGSPIPGVSTYYVKGLPTAARHQREVTQQLQSGTYQLGKE
jgi:hypothetical protein